MTQHENFGGRNYEVIARTLVSCSESTVRDGTTLMDCRMVNCEGYMPQHVWEVLLLENNMTEEATLARCDARIHLESVVVENPNLFDEWNSSNSEQMDSWYRRSLYAVIENDIEDWGQKVRKVKEAVI